MRLAFAALTIPCLLLAGCGDEEADTSPSPPTPEVNETSAAAPPTSKPAESTAPADPTIEVRAAVKDYSDAFLTGDLEVAYSLLTERCQDRLPRADFGAAVEAASAAYGSALDIETFEAEVNGDQARVTYTYAVSAIDQLQEPWAREDGAWRNDDC